MKAFWSICSTLSTALFAAELLMVFEIWHSNLAFACLRLVFSFPVSLIVHPAGRYCWLQSPLISDQMIKAFNHFPWQSSGYLRPTTPDACWVQAMIGCGEGILCTMMKYNCSANFREDYIYEGSFWEGNITETCSLWRLFGRRILSRSTGSVSLGILT